MPPLAAVIPAFMAFWGSSLRVQARLHRIAGCSSSICWALWALSSACVMEWRSVIRFLSSRESYSIVPFSALVHMIGQLPLVGQGLEPTRGGGGGFEVNGSARATAVSFDFPTER